ncbi:hypothetical protein BH23GEM5_BH23GEM5_02280 [soil metagenome]
METALALVTPQTARRGLTITNQRGPEADELYCGDEDGIRQVMVNLLSNAVTFTEPGGTVAVRCGIAAQGAEGQPAGEGAWAYISVEDTGIGIAPDQIGAVFEALVQAESGRTRTKGETGVGLPMSRQLARLMGGDLVLKSELGAEQAWEKIEPFDTLQPDQAARVADNHLVQSRISLSRSSAG